MKILIIEDEKELAKSIAEYLSTENYLCEKAATFHEAMYKIEIFNYDCILLDITLGNGALQIGILRFLSGVILQEHMLSSINMVVRQ